MGKYNLQLKAEFGNQILLVTRVISVEEIPDQGETESSRKQGFDSLMDSDYKFQIQRSKFGS